MEEKKPLLNEQPTAAIAPTETGNSNNDNKNIITTMDEKKPKKLPLPPQVKKDERSFTFGVLNLLFSTMMISGGLVGG
jgi:hypothetical protein